MVVIPKVAKMVMIRNSRWLSFPYMVKHLNDFSRITRPMQEACGAPLYHKIAESIPFGS